MVNLFIALYIAPFSIPMSTEITENQILFYYIYLSITSINLIISELWLAYSALNYYKKIKYQSIEPWIKRRYQIIGYSALILSIEAVAYLFIPWSAEGLYNPQILFVAIIVSIVTVVFSFGNVIGWIMPQNLKIYFNKNYNPITEQPLDEQELLDKIKSELARRE
jgi:hypothetical protein